MNVYEYAMKVEKEGEAYYRELASKSPNSGLKRIFTIIEQKNNKPTITIIWDSLFKLNRNCMRCNDTPTKKYIKADAYNLNIGRRIRARRTKYNTRKLRHLNIINTTKNTQ